MNILSSPRRISMALGVLRFAKMFLGVIVLYLAVKYFGTTYERDSWVLSIALYSMVLLAVFSPINDIFRTRFIHLKSQQGEEFAIESVNSLLSAYWCLFAVIAVVMFLAKGFIVQWIAPGFSDEEQHFLSIMLLWLFPYFMCQQVTNTQIAILNTYESYFYPEIISLAASVINIVAIVLLSDYCGIYSMVIATLVNNVIMVTVLSLLLKQRVPGIRLYGWGGLEKSKMFLLFSLPVYLATFSNQAYQMIEKAICTNYGTGAVSLFDYARQVMNLPWVVFSSIVPIVLTPILSKCFIEKDEARFSKELRQFTRMLLFVSVVVSVVMVVNPAQISLIFFSEVNVEFVAVMRWMGVAINFTILSLIVSQALIAENRIVKYVIGIVAGNLLSIGLCLFVSKYYPLSSLALFLMVGQLLSSIFLMIFLQVESKAAYLKDLFKMALMLCLIVSALGAMQIFVLDQIFLNGGVFMQFANLAISMVLTLTLILLALFLFNMEEKGIVLGLASKLIKREK